MSETKSGTATVEIASEAASLLSGKIVSPHQALYAEGKRVSVLVAPFWDDDGGTFGIRITFDASGYGMVWEGASILIEAESGFYWISFLDTRGFAAVSGLPVGEYSLSMPGSYGRSGERLPSERTYDWSRVYVSADGLVGMTAAVVKGEFILAAETREHRYANATVPFQLVDVGGDRIRLSGKITMEPRPEDAGVWEGRWTPPTPEDALKCADTEEHELEFCVIPESS